LINRVEMSKDNTTKGAEFIAHFVGGILEKRGKAMKEKSTKAFKADYKAQIAQPTAGAIVVATSQELTLSAKVTAPRESFDKDAFMAIIADKFDTSLHALQTIADTCTKQSAAPVSFTTSLVTKGTDDE
jgi:hypothetical protein